jgi:hypothetical protein
MISIEYIFLIIAIIIIITIILIKTGIVRKLYNLYKLKKEIDNQVKELQKVLNIKLK